MPIGGPNTPASDSSRRTTTAPSLESPRPNQSFGHVGKPHPPPASRAHHSRTVIAGSQLSFSQPRTSSATASSFSTPASMAVTVPSGATAGPSPLLGPWAGLDELDD